MAGLSDTALASRNGSPSYTLAEVPDAPSNNPTPPPRAFTQGVGTVYQLAGVLLFGVMMSVCCGSAFFSLDVASRPELAQIGWFADGDGPRYSAQKATSVALAVAIGLGVTVASLGLGLQTMHRRAPMGAICVSGFGVIFWAVHAVFFAQVLGSAALTTVSAVLGVGFAALLGLAIGAWRDMRSNPPPADLSILPEGYKIPYSHLHQDPPEVRLAKELEERRRKLEIQQKELEALEERIRKHRYD